MCCSVIALGQCQSMRTFNLGIECYENKTLEACYAYPYFQTDTESGDPIFYMLAVIPQDTRQWNKFYIDGPLLRFKVAADPDHPYSGLIDSFNLPSRLPVFNIIRNSAMPGFGTYTDYEDQPHLNFGGTANWFACGVANPQNLPYWTIIHTGDNATTPEACQSIKLHIEYAPQPSPTPL